MKLIRGLKINSEIRDSRSLRNCNLYLPANLSRPLIPPVNLVTRTTTKNQFTPPTFSVFHAPWITIPTRGFELHFVHDHCRSTSATTSNTSNRRGASIDVRCAEWPGCHWITVSRDRGTGSTEKWIHWNEAMDVGSNDVIVAGISADIYIYIYKYIFFHRFCVRAHRNIPFFLFFFFFSFLCAHTGKRAFIGACARTGLVSRALPTSNYSCISFQVSKFEYDTCWRGSIGTRTPGVEIGMIMLLSCLNGNCVNAIIKYWLRYVWLKARQ